MPLEDSTVIDFASVEKRSGIAVLTIADAWDWSDVSAHLLALQKKLNAYFEFIECGQVFEVYPSAKGRQIVIDVVGRHEVPDSARSFFAIANETASQLDVTVRHRMLQT